MQEVFNLIENVGQVDTTVLITGESGTGKELTAEALHSESSRKNGTLVKVDCASIPEELLESELFGHEKGAFTGAQYARKGKFEMADGGTIFLDEIGEMPLALQAKMLRILQEKQFERIGGIKTYTANVRIIAATNVSLEKEIARGKFRADLFYRLNVVPILLPPLRERKDDIPLLFNHFLQKSNNRNDKELKITSELLDFLIDYHWPGNVRELQNYVERVVLMAEGDELTLDFAKQLIEHEAIGADEVTDYLSVSFSSTDYVGHLFGASSLEAEDNLLRLDRTLADLLRFVPIVIGLAGNVGIQAATNQELERSELPMMLVNVSGNYPLDKLKTVAEGVSRMRASVHHLRVHRRHAADGGQIRWQPGTVRQR